MLVKPLSIRNIRNIIIALLAAVVLLLVASIPAMADTVGKVTGNLVNIRSGAGTSYNSIGAANKGDTFVVLNKEGDWYMVRYHGGVRGWINGQYLQISQNTMLPGSVKAGSGSVNIRAEASSSGALLGSFSGSAALPVIGESGYWYAVTYNSRTGYVAKWLVTADYTAAAPLEDSIYAPALVDTETLNLRDAPEGEILAKLAANTRLYVLGSKDGWYQVQTEQGNGWVHGSYVLFDQAQTSTEAIGVVNPPTFNGSQAQGRIDIRWQQESFGYQLILEGDALIRYQLQDNERGLSIVTDMEFSGDLPSDNTMQMYFEGAFNNTLTINGSDVLHYSLTEEQYGRRLCLTVGLSPLIGRVIYLDPGHAAIMESGKIDPGTLKGNLQEKDITYEIALYMQEILAAKGGTVLLSRGETTDLTLERRAYPANAANADILVSVHVNSATNANASGSSTWFYAPSNDDGYDRESCRLLAECIQRAMLASGGLNDYGIREANFAVLRASEMPAVLVETAFLTNEGDEAKLADPHFRRLLAEGIANGIIEYFRLTN